MDGRSPRGYGNIYTPHAGSMVIQVQREGGLQSRTIILSPRQVQLLRFFLSRGGRILAAVMALVVLALTVEAARVPGLTRELSTLEHTATRLDTLQRSLAELQRRYDQVQRMLGAAPAQPGESMTPVGDSIRRPAGARAPRQRPAPSSENSPALGTAPAADTADFSARPDSGAAGSPAARKPAAPMD
jgi:hypothetical protein